MHINFSKYMFSSSRTCFFSSPQWVCWMGGITCKHTMTCMLLHSFACDQQHCSQCLLRASYWEGYLTCMREVSSMSVCCTPCCTYSYCNSFTCLYSSCSSLSCCFSTWKSFSFPFSVFAQSPCHTVSSYHESPKFLSSQVDMLELATLFHLYVVTAFLLHSLHTVCFL